MIISNFKLPNSNLNQNGQIVIILLLIMLVGLVLAISVTQRSVNDLTVSTQTEQSTRAFSAAEAGLERALSDPTFGVGATPSLLNSTDTGNDSQAEVKVKSGLPLDLTQMTGVPNHTGFGQADEEPKPINTDSIAQFWLADPAPTLSPPLPAVYTSSGIKIYYGDNSLGQSPLTVHTDTKLPAMEIYYIARDSSGNYIRSRPFLYDTVDARAKGAFGNQFFNQVKINAVNSSAKDDSIYCPNSGYTINTDNSPNNLVQDRSFRCAVRLDLTDPKFNLSSSLTPIMLRIRFLYSDNTPIAVEPELGNLPYQKTVYTAIGKAGQSIKTVQVTQKTAVFLPFFDFAIFSGDDITK